MVEPYTCDMVVVYMFMTVYLSITVQQLTVGCSMHTFVVQLKYIKACFTTIPQPEMEVSLLQYRTVLRWLKGAIFTIILLLIREELFIHLIYLR